MKRGRKSEWTPPAWALKRVRELGLSDDSLDTALKIGVKVLETDCQQLTERRRSINAVWNDAPVTGGSDRQHDQQPDDGDVGVSVESAGHDLDSGNVTISEFEDRPIDAIIGPGLGAPDDAHLNGDSQEPE